MRGGIGALDRHRHEPGLVPQLREVEQAMARAEALVGLLQRDDVRSDLSDDLGDAGGVEAAVDADAFVDVVGGDQRPAAPIIGPGMGGAGPILALAQGGDDAGRQALALLLHRSAGSCSGPVRMHGSTA